MMTEHFIDLRLRWFLFLLLFGLYLLIYTGIPDSADGKALLAVATALVRHGDTDISIIGAEDARFQFDMSRMGVFGNDGALYSKKGITPSLALIPFVVVAQVMPWLSTTATAMLFNSVVTAATAVILYRFVREMGCRPRVALVTSLLYGVATTAFVYAKTLYGEPLAGLLLITAFFAAYRYRSTGSRRNLIIIGAMVGLATGINLTYALMLPILVGYALVKRSVRWTLVRRSLFVSIRKFSLILTNKGLNPLVWDFTVGFFALAPFVLILIGIGIYNWARFGSPLTSGYYFSAGEGFNKPFLMGVFGLTLSPYRGIFWYSPLLLLATPGWLWLRRQQSVLAWIIGAIVFTQIASYATWWSWHGGITWGTRFLVPIIPVMMLALVPVVERAFEVRGIRWALIAVALISIGIQLLGALYSYFPYTGHLMRTYPAGAQDHMIDSLSDSVLFNPSASPIWGHLRMFVERAPLDPAWLANDVRWMTPLAVLLLVVAAYLVLRAQRGTALIGIGAIVLAVHVVAGCDWGAVSCQQTDELQVMLQPAATTVIASADLEAGLQDIKTGHILSMNAPTTPDDALASRMWEHARSLASEDLLWYVSWFPPADSQNWQERELWATAAFAFQREVNGHRALLFHLDPPSAELMSATFTFGDVVLIGRATELTYEGMFITLQWQAQSQLPADYSWFVHVIDAQGNILAQQDRPSQGGYLPTSRWEIGQLITDYLYFPMDATTAEHSVSLRVGWVNPLTGERLPTSEAQNRAADQGFVLVPIQSE